MSYNRYEAKANYVKAKNAQNERIESLTQEQHRLIQAICAFRHEVHCNIKSYFNSGIKHSAKIVTDDFCAELFCDDFLFELNAKLKRLELPKFNTSFDFVDCPDDSWVGLDSGIDRDEDEEAWEDEYNELLDDCYHQFNKFNNDIESWLLAIDDEHGTSYCPTGFARLK